MTAPKAEALAAALLDDIDTMFGPIQFGHAGSHHGIGTKDCPRDTHHHHDERCVSIKAKLDAIIAAAHAEGRAAGLPSVEALSETVDKHWLLVTPEVAFCSCREWVFAVAESSPLALGDRFLPFSKHVAAAILAALAQQRGEP